MRGRSSRTLDRRAFLHTGYASIARRLTGQQQCIEIPGPYRGISVDDRWPFSGGPAAAARAIGETDSLDPVLASPVRLIYFIS